MSKQFWYDRTILRSAILLGLAAAAIQLAVTYFQKIQQPLPDGPTYHVLSSGYVEPGQPASVRISARMLDTKNLVPVTVDDVSLDDAPVHFRVTGTGPSAITIDTPSVLSEQSKLVLKARSEGSSHRTITLPVSVGRPSARFSFLPEESSLSTVNDAFRVDLLPTELVMGMNNRVFVFVRKADGTPASKVLVDVAYRGGKATGTTNNVGLFEFLMPDPQPAFECDIRLNGDQYETTESLRAYGKGIQLRPHDVSVKVGHPHRVFVQTRNESVPIYCDLRRGTVWRQSWVDKTRQHRTEIKLPGLPAGLYHFQCALHDLKSGEAVATTPIVVSDESPPKALLSLIQDNRIWYKTSIVKESDIIQTGEQTLRFLLESLVEPPYGGDVPTIFTAEEDKQIRLENRKDELASFLPFVVALLLLVVIWMTEINVRRRAENRARFIALNAEESLSDLGITADASELVLVPFNLRRAVLLGAVALGVIALNALLMRHADLIL